MKIIAFTGKKGSGKTTASNFVRRNYTQTNTLNFKTALIAEMCRNFDKTLRVISDDMTSIEGEWGDGSEWTVERLFQEKPPIMRALMQNYGTEVRRGDDENHWVKKWKNSVLKSNFNVVCDDVRFENEFLAVKDLGGTVVRIIRLNQQNTPDSHSSELEMDSLIPDHTITVKDGDIDSLEHELQNILMKEKWSGNL